jgi:hypothetical protein
VIAGVMLEKWRQSGNEKMAILLQRKLRVREKKH